MSDSIVLWCMCVVWGRARPVLIFGAALLVTTSGLNIANMIAQAGIQARRGIAYNGQDSEIIVTYGETSIGLAAAFMSLTSNLCATAIVGLKAWYAVLCTTYSVFLSIAGCIEGNSLCTSGLTTVVR